MPDSFTDLGQPFVQCYDGLLSDQLVAQLWLPGFAMSEDKRTQVREHVATCDHCQVAVRGRVALDPAGSQHLMDWLGSLVQASATEQS